MFSLVSKDERYIKIDFKEEQFTLDCSFNVVLEAMYYFGNPDISTITLIEIIYLLFVVESTTEELDILEKLALVEFIFDDVLKEKTPEKIIFDRRGEPMPSKKKDQVDQEVEPAFSFEQDAALIYSSFLYAYGIDLHEQLDKMSWEKFRNLLRDLPAETKFKKVVEIREWKPEKGTSAKEKAKMKELQEQYALVKRPKG